MQRILKGDEGIEFRLTIPVTTKTSKNWSTKIYRVYVTFIMVYGDNIVNILEPQQLADHLIKS
ncbi:hypothetical protein J6590_089031 [Homalodisca vitripennis]|nr:hypothetical protein J6590_089031 [Homalodisca vitripennis]